jgi:hypothetical protein
MNEYMNRMEVLAEEINSGKLRSNMAIGIKLHPATVDWSAFKNFTDASEYDGLFFVESLNMGNDWNGEALADYLETLTREFVA